MKRTKQHTAGAARSVRDHLIETALVLFQRHGFHATGIDHILAESGVAKMSLYKHFASKDQLILDVLRVRDERFCQWLKHAVERRATAGPDRLLAVIDALEEWVTGDDFTGCLFINATAEYGAAGDPVRTLASEHKARVKAYLLELAHSSGVANPDEVANTLALLKEGIIVSAQVSKSKTALVSARRILATMMAGTN